MTTAGAVSTPPSPTSRPSTRPSSLSPGRWSDPEREGAVRLAGRDRLLALLDVHVAKEEVGLYPELMASGDLSGESDDALEDEHREIRHALVTGSFDRRDFFALAAHVEQEEMELFSAAMFAFDDEVWDRLDAIHDGIALAPAH